MPKKEPVQDLDIPLKLVLLGDGAVGKTMLIYSFKEKNFKGEEYMPHVIDPYSVTLSLNEKTRVMLEIYDTNGQEDYRDIRKLSVMDSSAVILCYSCNSNVTLDNAASQWVNEIKQTQSRENKEVPPPFILCGTKQDLYLNHDVDHIPPKLGLKVARDIGAAYHVRCSALLYGNGNGNEAKGKVQEVFKKAVRAGIEVGPYKDIVPPPKPRFPCMLC